MLCAVAVAGICLADVSSGRTLRSPDQVPASGSGVISGLVRLGEPGGEPVASVDVLASDTASGEAVARGQTDRDGRFALSVAPGRYTVSAARAGFLTSSYGSSSNSLPGAPLVVGAGERLELSLTIRRAGVVSGYVRDDSGRPIDGADVRVVRASVREGAPDRTAAAVRTDRDGFYRAYGLAPGRYLVAASAPAAPIVSSAAGDRLRWPAPRFYPGADRESLAVPVAVSANEEQSGVDLMLTRLPVTTVTGALIPPPHLRLLDDIVIVATAVDGTPPVPGIPLMVKGGEFVAQLHPGRYRLDVRAGGARIDPGGPGGAETYYASTVVEVEDVTSVRLDVPVRPAVTVSGTVRGVGRDPAGLGVRLVPVVVSRSVARPAEAAIGADGRFVAARVAPGRYAVELMDAGPVWGLDAVRVRGQRMDGLTIDVDESIGVDELELLVVARTASLSGRIAGAAESAASWILVLVSSGDAPQRAPTASRVYLARADNKAEYLFPHCAAGTYVLVMLTELDPADLENDAFLDQLRASPSAVPVTLTADARTRLDVQVKTPGVFSPSPITSPAG